jgi:hypothetical protein
VCAVVAFSGCATCGDSTTADESIPHFKAPTSARFLPLPEQEALCELLLS